MATSDEIYDGGLQIFLALDAIYSHRSDGEVAAAINVINEWMPTYFAAVQTCWTGIHGLNNVNAQWLAAFTEWATHCETRIDAVLAPIILYANSHGGTYDMNAITAARPDIAVCMGDLNIFRNPYAQAQYQAPYTDHQ